ncbi:hypothetical protein C8F04DRAFT_269569 [Mycena alexandri]|uniref:Uncharacterized protein n=1 Tax=Mycena alexandri TaxID=1745969 RepID=A0AAD6S5R2_9AGAR|nr:hypothetical protein C8F04DRAFT_269569 [Mycena alexandri]
MSVLISVERGCWFRTTHAQTLFYVSESQPAQTEIIYETFSLSAVGVGTDGATTYIQNVIESYAAFVESATTVTLMSTIATYTNTIIEDASGFREYSPLLDCGPDGCKVDTSAGPVVQTCTFGTDGHGTCVEKFPFLSEGVTYSGAVVPYYTLNNTATAPNTKATSHIGAIVGGVVGGVVLGLLGAAFLLWRRRKRRCPQAPLVTSSHDGASESKDVFQELQTLREEMRRLENGNVLREQALREEIRRMEVGAPPNYA